MPINNINDQDIRDFANGGYTLDNYQYIATKSAIYPGQGSPLGLIYAALKLNGEAGELAEHIGKAIRDDNYIPYGIDDDDNRYADLDKRLKREREELIIKEVGDVLWYLSAICSELNTTLSEAAAINLIKLKDRSERNKLQGSGDER